MKSKFTSILTSAGFVCTFILWNSLRNPFWGTLRVSLLRLVFSGRLPSSPLSLSLLSSLLKTTNGEVLLPRDSSSPPRLHSYSWCISPWCAPSWFLVLMLRPTSLSIKEYLFDRVLECLTMLTFGQNHPILSPHSKIACNTMFFESMKNKINLVTYTDFRYHIQHHQEPPCPPRLQDETWRTGLFLMGFLCSDFDKIFRRALIW